MDTFECIRTRRTTRTFVPKDLPENTIHRILVNGAVGYAVSNDRSEQAHYVVVASGAP